MSNPEYLYHYTTINTLALILKNKTIRFNKLTNTDDPEESKANDYDKPGRYMFVSCWMDGDEESIPMWGMYSKQSSGVRIKLPYYPFAEQDYSRVVLPHINLIGNKSVIPYKHLVNEKYTVPPLIISDYVEYTDDKIKLLPKVLYIDEGSYTLSMGDVGKYKRKAWVFQKEYRYRIMVFPIGLKQFDSDANDYADVLASMAYKNISNNVDLPMNYIDLKIDTKAFENMEITLGPNTTHSDRIIVDLLVEKYNPNIKLKDSELMNKILFK